MSTSGWNLLCVVHSLDEGKTVAKSNGVCQCRINNLVNSTKYSFKCSQYRKYALYNYELKAIVPDDDPNLITIMSRNNHNHEYRSETSRLPSPARDSVSKYVEIGLTKPQIHSSALLFDHPNTPVPSTKLTALIQTERRKNHPKIFSIFDFRQW